MGVGMGFNWMKVNLKSKIYNSKLLVRGFTLIELIIAIVLFGIIAYLGVSLLTPVMEGYVDTKTKTLLFNEAQFFVERASIELRNAIPNTIRTGDGYIQFGEFSQSAYYKQTSFDNLTYYGGLGSLSLNDNLSIYSTKPDYFYNKDRVYEVAKINSDNVTLNKALSSSSPYHRVYLISTPVTFYLKGNRIYRSFDYPIDNTTYGIDKGKYYVITSYVKSLNFTYTPGNFLHSGIVSINLVMEKNGVKLKYEYEVHIKNVP